MLLGAQALDAHPLHQAQRLVLADVVPQDQLGDLVGHRRQQLVARVQGQLLGLHHVVEQDLDVDLVVGGVHAGRVVDEVGVEQHAGLRGLDAAQLGQAEVAAFADHLAAQFAAVDAQAVVGAVADVAVGLAGGLDVGADAAVPEQVHRRLEDGVHQVVRRKLLDARLQAQRLAHRRADLDRLERARVDAAAGADQLGIVVGPAGARQLEQALALGEGRRRVRVRVEEDMTVVERGQQADVARQQHAVAEHVAGHVADAHAGEVLVLAVAAQRAEVALDRLPGAARGDAHALVVVADRAAGGERVAEPEAMGQRQAVGDVGERGGALVGGDHQVRVVLVVAHHLRRRHDLAADDVVGDVQQALDEQLVAGDALGQHRVAVAADRRALAEEAALGADRHDHRVLDHLRLDQAQHLGAEVLAPVGPAQAAARHRAEAQVHAFHARAVHEDLAVRARLGQVRHLGRIQLEADAVAQPAIGGALVVAGAQGRLDHALEAAQDAVLVEAGDLVEQLQQRGRDRVQLRLAAAAARVDHRLQHLQRGGVAVGQQAQLCRQRGLALGDLRLALAAGGRIEARLEQFHQQPRQQRIAVAGLFDVGLRERHAGLQQVLAVAAQHRDLAPAQAGADDQAVEAVVLGVAAPDPHERLAQRRVGGGHVDAAGQRLDLEVLDRQRRAVHHQPVRTLGDHPQAQVLHHRQHVRQRQVVVLAVQLQAQAVGAVAAQRLQAQVQVFRAAQRGQALDIARGDLRGGLLDVAGRQRAAVAGGQAQAVALAAAGHQRLAQVVVPVAQQVRQARLQLAGIELQGFARLRPHDQVQLRQRRLAQHHAGIDVLAVQRVLQQRLDAQAHVGVEALARDVHQRGNETAVLVAAQEQAAAHPLLQAEDAHRGAVQLLLVGLEQLLARQRLQDVAQRLAAVAARGQLGLAHDGVEALAHQRDLPRAAVVGAGGEQAEEALLGDDAALGVELQHADVVHVAAAVHPRARVGLGQDQRFLVARLAEAVRGQRAHRPRRRLVLPAQQAQAAVLQRRQHVFAALLLHPVLAVAEEGEMVGRGPAQEFLRLAPALVVHRQAPRGQVVGQRQHLLAHAAPVAHDVAHLAEDAPDRRFHLRHVLRRLAVDLQRHQRFRLALAHVLQHAALVALHAQHRMAEHVHADAQLRQRHAHRVDQERHVVVDDLQHRVRRLPAVVLQARVEHPHVDRARLALAREFQHRRGQRRPLLRAVVGELVLLHALVELLGERLRLVLAAARIALAQRREHRRQAETAGGRRRIDHLGGGRDGRGRLGHHRRLARSGGLGRRLALGRRLGRRRGRLGGGRGRGAARGGRGFGTGSGVFGFHDGEQQRCSMGKRELYRCAVQLPCCIANRRHAGGDAPDRAKCLQHRLHAAVTMLSRHRPLSTRTPRCQGCSNSKLDGIVHNQ
ncbi:hypothetical protein QE400_002382 [Xanthomonas sacchari]|nr:hypothetical protein [Xanthomonas sacchari]